MNDNCYTKEQLETANERACRLKLNPTEHTGFWVVDYRDLRYEGITPEMSCYNIIKWFLKYKRLIMAHIIPIIIGVPIIIFDLQYHANSTLPPEDIFPFSLFVVGLWVLYYIILDASILSPEMGIDLSSYFGTAPYSPPESCESCREDVCGHCASFDPRDIWGGLCCVDPETTPRYYKDIGCGRFHREIGKQIPDGVCRPDFGWI